MSRKFTARDFLHLSTAERVDLAEQIWDSVVDSPESVRLTDAQRSDLDARIEAVETNPTAGSDWPSVRNRIERR